MGIGQSSVSFSRASVLIVGQTILNVALALWLFNEYLHNPFMQSYLSDTWAWIWPEAALAIGVSAVALALLLYHQSLLNRPKGETDARVLHQEAELASSLGTIDQCPFCETPLKTIRVGRLQCRNCRRYFKSSLPKTLA